MLPALPSELADLLARLEAAGGASLPIAADELEAWPAALAEALRAQGAIERAPTATSVVCPGCERACVMPVDVRQAAGRQAVAFVACDKRADMGRVLLPLSLLDGWQMTPRTLAQALAGGAGAATVQAIASGWRVCRVAGAVGRTDVLLNYVGGVLYIGVAGHALPLADVLSWDGKRLELDVRTLARAADAPVGGLPPEGADARAARLRRRKAELKQAGVPGFLKRIAAEEGLSRTRVKQIIDRAELAARTGGGGPPQHPFDGVGARTGPVPHSTKRKG